MIETRVSGRPRDATAPLVFAAFSFRYDADLVPALIENISHIVDGWVSWDDRGATQAYSSEPARRGALIDAARLAGAQWLLAVDPDERYEDRLAAEIRMMTSIAEPAGWTFNLREMYTPDAYRVDGLWGQKQQMRLFPLSGAIAADGAALHGLWVSGQDQLAVRASGLNLYHLRMILPERRRQRRELYASLDPERRFQMVGYDYLTDDTGLELESVPHDRGFSPVHREDGGLWAAGTGPGEAVRPDPPAAQLELIKLMRKIGASRQAQNVARQLAEMHPQAIVPRMLQVATSLEAGDFENALAMTQALQQIYRDRAWLLWLRARALRAAGDLPQARTTLDRLLAREPGMVPAAHMRQAMSEGVDRFTAADAPWRRWVMGTSTLREGSCVKRADIAVVVLGYQAPSALAKAVASIRAQDSPAEIVVVNSGGGDPSTVLADHIEHVRLINVHERLYVGSARNIGIDASEAPIVAFLASDCQARAGWISSRLAKHGAGALAVSSAVVARPSKRMLDQISILSLYGTRSPGVPAELADRYGVSYARELFTRFGYFAPGMRVGEDTEFHRRALPRASIDWAPEVQTEHPTHRNWWHFARDMFVRGTRSNLDWPSSQLTISPSMRRVLLDQFANRTERLTTIAAYVEAPRRIGSRRLRFGLIVGSGFFVLGAAHAASRTRKAAKILKGTADAETPSRLQAERAVKLHPQNPLVHIALATALAQDSDPGAALASLESALRLRPADAQAAAAFLEVASTSIMPPDAILQFMENVACGAPDVARIWTLAARAAHQAGRHDRAELYALRALERAPLHKFTHKRLAAAQDAARRRDDARKTRAFLDSL